MKSGKFLLLTLLVPFLFLPTGFAQDDFEDELEAELEAELGDAENLEEQEVSLDDDSGESETSSESPKTNTNGDNKNAAEEFSGEDFESEFSEEDFADESFTADDTDFSEFEDDLEGDLQSEEAASKIPVEESLDEATQELELEPLEESPEFEDVVEPSSPPIQDTIEPVAEEPVEETPTIPAPVEEVVSDLGPNLEYESRLYNIYVNYHNTSTSEGQWLSIVGERQSELYQIRRGDTLWGVSETFFGDGNFWPKIWSVNNRIENPHLISSGNQIQFVMGTENDAPRFTVSEAATDAPETGDDSEELSLDMETINELIESGALDAADAEQFKAVVEEKAPDKKGDVAKKPQETKDEATGYSEPDIEIPPPSIVSRPVLKKLPPSVPEWQNSAKVGEYDDTGISYMRRPIADLKDEVFLSSYIDDVGATSDASVIEIEIGARIAWEAQYVYVRFPIGKGVPGEKYLVVENVGELKAPNGAIDDSELGYQKIISGMVTIGEKVKADVNEKKYDVFRAFVDKAIHPLKLGGELVRGRLPVIDLDGRGPRSDIVSQIIGGNFDKRRTVFGKGSVVFLNRGLSDGLSEGQVLSIRANRAVRNESTKIAENQRVIGSLKVVKVANKFATAVVTQSLENIFAGDYTGEGRLLQRLVKEQVEKSGMSESSEFREEFGDDTAFADDWGGDDQELENLLDEEDDSEFGDDDLNDFEGESDFE